MSCVILGIESSCDETSASICLNGKIINNIIATQSIHEEYGGVVPELASREHQKNIVPLIEKCLENAQLEVSNLHAIAATQGPGLLGALLVGYGFAKGLAYSLDIPLINVHHMRAHILAHFIDEPKPDFPFLCLTVSGGHTQIVLVKDYLEMEVIGQTRDDAVGEAFDKGAKLLGLGYPGGPLLDQHASNGDPHRFKFSESRMPGYDFSFSGVKTSILYFLKDRMKKDPEFIQHHLEDICAGYQFTLINMLMEKLIKASEDLKISQIAIAGGVAANSGLREGIRLEASKRDWKVYFPQLQYCTDNAAMIAMAGYFAYQEKKFANFTDTPLARMPF